MSDREYEQFIEGLNRKRAPALARAVELIANDQFDAAENEIRAVDSSIYGAVATANMYQHRLEQLVAEGVTRTNKPHVEAVFRRALSWAQGAYPEPHTGIEASNYDSGRAEDRAKLVRILGYDPDEQ